MQQQNAVPQNAVPQNAVPPIPGNIPMQVPDNKPTTFDDSDNNLPNMPLNPPIPQTENALNDAPNEIPQNEMKPNQQDDKADALSDDDDENETPIPPIQSFPLSIPEEKPFYYYAQIEQFNRDNILPQIKLQLSSNQPNLEMESDEQMGGSSEAVANANNYTPGLYGYFERTIDRFTGTSDKPTNTLYSSFSNAVNGVLGRKPDVSNQVIDLTEDNDSDNDIPIPGMDDDDDLSSDESTVFGNLEPEIEPDNNTEEDVKAIEFIETKLPGTKLYYFVKRNKKFWV